MSKKIFNKNLPKLCEYCVFGTKSDIMNEVICLKRGVTGLRDSCRKYKYDPLKRRPNKAKLSENYDAELFSTKI